MIPIEETFDAAVRSIGGVRVQDLLNNEPDFENADYLLESYGVVAELKCLEEDKIHDPGITRKASEIYNRYLSQGEAPVFAFGKARISTEGLPSEFAREIIELYRKPIERRVRKANRQIRKTQKHFGAPYERGLLILANDGHTVLNPSHVRWILMNTLEKERFPSIGSVIYIAANLRARHPSTERDCMGIGAPRRCASMSSKCHRPPAQGLALASARSNGHPSRRRNRVIGSRI